MLLLRGAGRNEAELEQRLFQALSGSQTVLIGDALLLAAR